MSGAFQKVGRVLPFSGNSQLDIIYVLGKKLPAEEVAARQIKKMIWFSYREIYGVERIQSDCGWGCLIRVGQMAMAAALKKYLTLNKVCSEKQLDKLIITSFLDQRDSRKSMKYSLIKIVEKAGKQYKLSYGQWFNSSQICSILAMLHSKQPMKGAQNLVLAYCQNTIIYLEDIYSAFNQPMCQCTRKRIQCFNCSRNSNNQSYMKSIKNNEKHVLVFVPTRLGLKSVEKPQFEQLKKLLSLECSMGVIGGVPNKGLYIVGSCGNKLYYLDPHYVQKAIDFSNYDQYAHTFHFPDLREASRGDIDPSMALVFYLENLKQLRVLYEQLEKLKEQYYQNYIISMDWKNQFKSKVVSNGVEDDLESVYSYENSFMQ